MRNKEVNSRLARDHEIEVVTAAFPGCCPRTEQGVRYRQVGVGVSQIASVFSYLAALPAVVRSSSADLIVEEFAPPFSSVGVPRWSGRPTIGMVQWYFARQTARAHRLPSAPFTAVERWGTRGHTELIALSDDLADTLRRVAPHAHVSVIGMGVDAAALSVAPCPVPGRMVFLGRLDENQKGLDLLADVVDLISSESDVHLIIAGDGRDRATVEQRMLRIRGSRIEFVGRVTGTERWELLRSAQICVMPSRWETFGLTALEALACGVPVAAFDIPSLRTTIPDSAGVLVAPFDVAAFAHTLTDLLGDTERCVKMGRAGRAFAARFRWDDVAATQASIYSRVVAR